MNRNSTEQNRRLPFLRKGEVLRRPEDIERLWDEEYLHRKTLPSTGRDQPSRLMQKFEDRWRSKTKLSILDLGCGSGRHAVYFALKGFNVTAIDISGVALEMAYNKAIKEGCDSKIAFIHERVESYLARNQSDFDIILDSYMLCHVVDFYERAKILGLVANSLRRKGLFISFGISHRDKFYSPHSEAFAGKFAISRDSFTGIEKILTSTEFIQVELANLFRVEEAGYAGLPDRMGAVLFEKEAVYSVSLESRGFI